MEAQVVVRLEVVIVIIIGEVLHEGDLAGGTGLFGGADGGLSCVRNEGSSRLGGHLVLFIVSSGDLPVGS